jgi:hypothetical protein
MAWLYRQNHHVQYGQVMLLALNADGSNILDSYPQYITGTEPLIHSDHGIVVTSVTDIDAEMLVTDDMKNVPAGFDPLPVVQINIPGGRVELGNEMTSSKGTLDVTPGRYRVASFVSAAGAVTRVCFVLEKIN